MAALTERGTPCVHVAGDARPPAAYQRVFADELRAERRTGVHGRKAEPAALN
ncbi:hypothetical protein ACGFYU_15740 [Streptomyces sp. NPDC048337]|uniref:hypothetical protein n=1 Tax=Streptomyces sp. NPDC048337 TaxID=3365535 RepID=UPI003719FD42